MSNPEKMNVDEIEEETSESNEEWIDEEEAETREVVLALPALNIGQNLGVVAEEQQQAPLNEQVVSVVSEEQQVVLNEQAVVAAQLVMAAANEAVMKERSDGKKKKFRKPRKMKKMSEILGGSSSQGVEMKKVRKKASELSNPRGPPVCDICGRRFGSWKAVHGHLRSHSYEERNYHVLPPPPPPPPPTPTPTRKFSGLPPGFTIPGPNSAFVAYAGGGGGSVGGSAAAGDGQGGEEVRGVEIVDLNVNLVEKEEGEVEMAESEEVAKFDLNVTPQEDEHEEEKDRDN